LGRRIWQSAGEILRANQDNWFLFVNLHPDELMDARLLSADSPFAGAAHRVVLEITERASLASNHDVKARAAALRAQGFRLAVDDLGAGYAGLSTFALLEPEIVKIDMTLTRGIDQSPVKQKLVASMLALCSEIGVETVVEGVETPAERDMLIGLGCDLLQGFLFAHPGPPFPVPQW
jgi:EAL domain-containing protein (putative c-di-GMP-specific phosphodiesterase class I)